jgi:hypothetical protein
MIEGLQAVGIDPGKAGAMVAQGMTPALGDA